MFCQILYMSVITQFSTLLVWLYDGRMLYVRVQQSRTVLCYTCHSSPPVFSRIIGSIMMMVEQCQQWRHQPWPALCWHFIFISPVCIVMMDCWHCDEEQIVKSSRMTSSLHSSSYMIQMIGVCLSIKYLMLGMSSVIIFILINTDVITGTTRIDNILNYSIYFIF